MQFGRIVQGGKGVSVAKLNEKCVRKIRPGLAVKGIIHFSHINWLKFRGNKRLKKCL